jgi:serine/threonine protein kinase
MRYVPSRGIIHRDLKPSNILLDKKHHHVQICDFGSSRFRDVDSTLTQQVGTPQYMAPEMYEEPPYDSKVDVFSFGLIFYEILTGHPVFSPDLTAHKMVKKVLSKERSDLPPDVPGFIVNLIQMCWLPDPTDRPSFSDILAILEGTEFRISNNVNSNQVRSFLSWSESPPALILPPHEGKQNRNEEECDFDDQRIYLEEDGDA